MTKRWNSWAKRIRSTMVSSSGSEILLELNWPVGNGEGQRPSPDGGVKVSTAGPWDIKRSR